MTTRTRRRRPAPAPAPRTPPELRVTLGQSVWWQSQGGQQLLIDDLSDHHRANIARMLLRQAARYYAKKRFWEQFLAWGGAGSYGKDPDLDPPDDGEIWAQVREEIEQGKHLDWMRAQPLFIRMDLGNHLPDPEPVPTGWRDLLPGKVGDDF